MLLDVKYEFKNIMYKLIVNRCIQIFFLNHIWLVEYISNYYWSSKRIIKCQKSKIIRFVHFKKCKDVENKTKKYYYYMCHMIIHNLSLKYIRELGWSL